MLNSQPLTYTVSFENEPTAMLPAQQVVVTDKLDPTKVDLTTLSLGPVGFNYAARGQRLRGFPCRTGPR